MIKPERGPLDWYRDLCQMYWSNGLLSMLSDDLICILSGQGARMDGSDFTFQVDLIHAVDQMDGYSPDYCAISPTAFVLNTSTEYILFAFTSFYFSSRQLLGVDIRSFTDAGCKTFYWSWRMAKMTSSWLVVFICIERYVRTTFELCRNRN